MNIDKDMKKRVSKHPYELTGTLVLSGSEVIIGSCREDDDDTVILVTEDSVEPIFMSRNEARLLAKVLELAADNT